MVDQSRLDDLRRRVQKDPASIAFAQLAEEYRRAEMFDEAVEVCRAGLARHPEYLSARVTLGRTLIALHQLDEAQVELDRVLKSAPENLAAIRGLAEIHYRRGNLNEALEQYQAALALARNDPDLEHSVEELSRMVGPPPASAAHPEPLSFDHTKDHLVTSFKSAAHADSHETRPAGPPEPPAVIASESQTPAAHTIQALERFLARIHGSRSDFST